MLTRTRWVVVAAWAAALAGCSAEADLPSGSGGSSSGGALGSGGAIGSGGATSFGGAASLGGATTLGGSTSKGGTTSLGGSTSLGGALSFGGSSGGATTLGGSTAAGGSAGSAAGGAAGSATGGAASGGATSSGGATNTGGGSATTTTKHAFLLLGQSNMVGYPQIANADRTTDDRIRVLAISTCNGRTTDQWAKATPPLHECGAGLGPGDYFSRTILPKYPSGHEVLLVPCAINGEKIETFMKSGGSRYNWIVNRAKKVMDAGGKIEGILLHQGESNAGDPMWPGKVNTLITDLRTDLGIGNVPFLAGELAPMGNSKQHNEQIAKIPMVVTNGFVVSAQGLTVDPGDTQWNVHFSHDSVVEQGKRYGNKMIEALKL